MTFSITCTDVSLSERFRDYLLVKPPVNYLGHFRDAQNAPELNHLSKEPRVVVLEES